MEVGMLKRKIESVFEIWRQKGKKPALLVMGARQVGKTTSIRRFAQQNYPYFLEINFEEKPLLKSIFEGNLDADSIYEKIAVAGLGNLVPHQTLLFLDEIQSCPNARTAIKFLVEDGRCDIIESGSLLGINYGDVSSFPVGSERKVDMHSLDFEEFLWAMGISESILSKVRQNYLLKTPVDPFIHGRFMEYFQRYLIVGGMPAVITEYQQGKNLVGALENQKMIVGSYRDDIAKYAGRNKANAMAIFDSIPNQLSEKNKKFVLADLEEGASHRKYGEPLYWLSDAGIALFCYNISQLVLPFELNQRRSIFKFFLSDTGLLSSMSLGNVQQAILNGDLNVNQGAITENGVAELLVKNGHSLHYYDVKGRQEIDFVIEKDRKVIPLEVKSGLDAHHHPSLTHLLGDVHVTIESAIVLCRENISIEGKVIYLPLYMVMFL